MLHEKNKLYSPSVYTDARPKPWVVGTDIPIIAKEETQLTYYLRYFWGVNTTFHWFLGGQLLDGQSLGADNHIDGSATFGSALPYNFTRIDDEHRLTCSVSVEGPNDNFSSTSSVYLNIYRT